jgi:hypothetical protein
LNTFSAKTNVYLVKTRKNIVFVPYLMVFSLISIVFLKCYLEINVSKILSYKQGCQLNFEVSEEAMKLFLMEYCTLQNITTYSITNIQGAPT